MTVRAWFTISALCLLALGAAIAVRFFSPIPAPELMVNAQDVRLDGVRNSFCWPQRDGEPRCGKNDESPPAAEVALPPTGSMRIVAIYPVQPDDGSIQVLRASDRERVLQEPWTDRLRYELEPGLYVLRVEARYQANAFVRYSFSFRIGEVGG